MTGNCSHSHAAAASLLIGATRPQADRSDYLRYDRHTLVDYFDFVGLPYSIAAQRRAKRAINLRYDVLVFKD